MAELRRLPLPQDGWTVRATGGEGSPLVGSRAIEVGAFMHASIHAALRGIGLSVFQTYGHVADGNLHLVVGYPADQPEQKKRINDLVYRSIGDLGGSVSAEHGVGLEKKPYLALSRSPAEIALMRSLKAAIDPHGLLNPGRIFDA